MTVTREAKQGQLLQGKDEEIIYTLNTTPWGGSPSSPSHKVYDQTAADADVTATVSPGSATASGNVITLPKLKALTEHHVYRVEVKFSAGGSVWEPYFTVRVDRTGFSYGGDPENNQLDYVRDRIGDTDPGDPLLYDKEVTVEINTQASLLWAAAACAHKIANRFARNVTAQVGNDKEQSSDLFAHYTRMAASLSDEARADTASYRSGVRTAAMKPVTQPATYLDRPGDCGVVVKKV